MKPLPHRKLAEEARRAVIEAAARIGSEDYDLKREVEKAEKAISRATGHKHVALLSSCNAAILAAAKAVKGRVMVPDQGGWKGFKVYPSLWGRRIVELKTELGLIDPEVLEEGIRKEEPEILYITSFAGYIAEQPVEELYKVCREAGVLLLEDASGAMGDRKLGRGKHADIIICSTGAPKILNLYAGGFISTSDEAVFRRAQEIFKACKINPIIIPGIVEELKIAPRVVEALTKAAAFLKNELNTAIHRDKRGVCVGLELESPRGAAKKAYQRGLRTDTWASVLTVCPKYERFLRKGVAVELKKLDILRVRDEELLGLARILERYK